MLGTGEPEAALCERRRVGSRYGRSHGEGGRLPARAREPATRLADALRAADRPQARPVPNPVLAVDAPDARVTTPARAPAGIGPLRLRRLQPSRLRPGLRPVRPRHRVRARGRSERTLSRRPERPRAGW